MKRALLILSLMTILTACAGPWQIVQPDKPLAERQRDVIECQAIAAQSAQGTGGWSSDPALRNAFFTQARDAYLGQCLQSRGWSISR